MRSLPGHGCIESVRRCGSSPVSHIGTTVRFGKIGDADAILIASAHEQGGVIFADGIEKDHLSSDWGRLGQVLVASWQLNLVVP